MYMSSLLIILLVVEVSVARTLYKRFDLDSVYASIQNEKKESEKPKDPDIDFDYDGLQGLGKHATDAGAAIKQNFFNAGAKSGLVAGGFLANLAHYMLDKAHKGVLYVGPKAVNGLEYLQNKGNSVLQFARDNVTKSGTFVVNQLEKITSGLDEVAEPPKSEVSPEAPVKKKKSKKKKSVKKKKKKKSDTIVEQKSGTIGEQTNDQVGQKKKKKKKKKTETNQETGLCGNWIEIAYGTSSGTVRVIVQHPETVGHAPQLFQTFTVHQSPVTKVTLSEKYLVSVCCEYNHVRTWSVTRFRGMISTQPGSTPVASFKIVSLEEVEPCISYAAGNDCGPFGEQDDEQVFIQKVIPETPELYVRLASNGKRVCVIKAVDGITITCFCVHECDGSSRMGSRPRRFIFTGHSNGALQMWDLTTALDLCAKSDQASQSNGGPSAEELLRLLDQCDLSTSHCSTPCISPCPTLLGSAARIKASNMAFLNQSIVQQTDGQAAGAVTTSASISASSNSTTSTESKSLF